MTTYQPTAAHLTYARQANLITVEAFNILSVRYGFFGVGPMNLWEAAEHFSTDRASIRQTEAKAMAALRKTFGSI